MSGKPQIRLALRHEGKMWNAYVAQPGTMEGAKLIGSVIIEAVDGVEGVKDGFVDLMKVILRVAVQRAYGVEPKEWDVQAAAESERAGNA